MTKCFLLLGCTPSSYPLSTLALLFITLRPVFTVITYLDAHSHSAIFMFNQNWPQRVPAPSGWQCKTYNTINQHPALQLKSGSHQNMLLVVLAVKDSVCLWSLPPFLIHRLETHYLIALEAFSRCNFFHKLYTIFQHFQGREYLESEGNLVAHFHLNLDPCGAVDPPTFRTCRQRIGAFTADIISLAFSICIS